MITMTLDTSCFDKTEICNNNGLIIELSPLQQKGLVKLYRGCFTDIESARLKGKRGNTVREFIQGNSSRPHRNCFVDINATEDEKRKQVEKNRGYTSEESNDVHKRIDSILRKYCNENNLSGLNDYIDVRLLGQHILEKRDIFLTKNTKDYITDGKRNIQSELENEFPDLKIRELNNDFLKELKGQLKNCN